MAISLTVPSGRWEAVGNVTGDARTRDEGRADQAKSNLKDAGEKVNDAFKK